MKTNKSNTEIEKRRKNSKFFKLVESIPYGNSKVGQTFVMKVSSRNTIKP
jgi:hypothetical protein